MQTGIITKSRSKPRNVLRGILGIADATWGVAPTNLANVTDGNKDTVSGTGTKTLSGSGNIGYITFDLGSIKTVLIGGKIGVWSTANGITAYLQVSDDGNTYRTTTIIISGSTSTSEIIVDCVPAIISTRYIKLRFYGSGAMDANIKLYEFRGWDLGS